MFKSFASLKTGLGFGLTSAAITTLGLLVGLDSSTHSRLAVLGGIFTIAVADAFSDALGMHVSEESRGVSTKRAWLAALFTFFAKFFFALTFALPIILLSYDLAIRVSLIWGALIIAILSFIIARVNKANPFRAMTEHLVVGALVVVLARYVGGLINRYLN